MRVLVVDDEMPARERLRRMLDTMDGCSVCGEAADGEEALRQCARLQPDVLLMDIRMPSMDGLEAARHLLALERPPAVIFTTAYSEHALAAFETHAVDYLLKPVRHERLAQALMNTRRLTRVQAAALPHLCPCPRQSAADCGRGDTLFPCRPEVCHGSHGRQSGADRGIAQVTGRGVCRPVCPCTPQCPDCARLPGRDRAGYRQPVRVTAARRGGVTGNQPPPSS